MIRTLLTIPLLIFAFWLGWFLNGVDRGKELTAAYTLGVKETTVMFNKAFKGN